MGDFNFPKIDWKNIDSRDQFSQKFISFLLDNHLTQLIKEGTYIPSGNILDLVITNNPFLIDDLSVLDNLTEGCDHNMISFSVPYSFETKVTECYNYSKANWDKIELFLSSINWNDVFNSCASIDDFWLVFTQIFAQLKRSCVPKSRFHSDKKHSEIPFAILKKIKKKRHLWRLFCRTQNNLFKKQHRALANEIKKEIRSFNSRKEENLLNSKDIKKFFKFVRSKLSHRANIPPLESQGSIISDSHVKSNMFNDFFGSVFTTDDGSLPTFPNRTAETKSNIIFNEKLIEKAIDKLKIDSSPGPDDIPSIFFKKLKREIAKPLRILFEVSFRTGKLPSDWKNANVTPVFKRKGSPAKVENYRPISLTSITSKLMERVISEQMIEFLDCNNLISPHQHGFRSKHSTLTQLLECLQDWSFSVSNGLPTDVIYLDFAKAFDSVSHEKLIYKLQAYGICGDLLEWIKSFLFDRKQRVIIENSPSNYIHVASGVPQGTILGPLLFLIFINDMADEIFWSKIKLYADDSKVYSEINNANDVNNLQADINRLSDWTNSWQLNLSIQKCSVLHLKPKETPDVYLIDNIPLPSSDFMKDLGVIMSQDLKFHDHCSAVSNKAHSVCGLILRCFVTKSPDFMVKMFITFARSILEYCSPAWSPYHICDIDKIENVQRRFTKRISGLYETPYLDRLAFLKLESLETRRIKFDIQNCAFLN